MSLRFLTAVLRPRVHRLPVLAGGLLVALLAVGTPRAEEAPGLAAPTAEAAATEETRALAEELFAALEAGDAQPLIDRLDQRVRWTITGSSSLAGIYDGKQAFLNGPYRRLAAALKEPLHARVQRILADGEWVAVQWLGAATAQNGAAFSNEYCWIARFEGGRIIEVTSYFDGARIDGLPAAGR